MGIITYIDGIPAFSTQLEALAWGRQHGGIQGFHTHIVDEQTTYMAGVDHNAIMSRYTTMQSIPAITVEPVSMPEIPPTQQVSQTNQPTQQSIQQPVPDPTPTSTPPTTTGGGNGGGY